MFLNLSNCSEVTEVVVGLVSVIPWGGLYDGTLPELKMASSNLNGDWGKNW